MRRLVGISTTVVRLLLTVVILRRHLVWRSQYAMVDIKIVDTGIVDRGKHTWINWIYGIKHKKGGFVESLAMEFVRIE